VFKALAEALPRTTEPGELVKLSDAMRRTLRDLGVLDDVPELPANGDGYRDPSRLLG